jgi:hypothetical protein
MGKVLVGGGAGDSTFVTSAYLVPVGALVRSTVELTITMRVAGTVSRYAASINANGATRSGRLRKNSTNVNGILTFTDSVAQVLYDTTHTDDYAIGDTFGVFCTDNGTHPRYNWQSFVFEAAGGASVGFLGTSGTQSIGAYFKILGGLSQQASNEYTTESLQQNKMRTSGTVQFCTVLNPTAVGSGTNTWTLRKNGVDTAIAIAVPMTSTGKFEDTTHSVSFVSGDLLGWRCSGSTVSSSGLQHPIACITYAGNAYEVVAGPGGLTANASDRFIALTAAAGVPDLTEAPQKMQHGFAGTIAKLRANVAASTFSGAITIKLRKNGADASNAISLTAGTTGWFEDASSIDTFAAGDDINYVVRGGTSGGGTIAAIMVTETPSGATLVATNLTVGSPVLGTPVYAKNSIVFTASFPPHSPDLDTPTLIEKNKLVAVGITVASPFIQIPGLTGISAAGFAVASPEFGRPGLKHPYGPFPAIPTHSSQLAEAVAILNRALDALTGAVPGRQVGRPAWDFRRAVGAIRSNGKSLINDGTLGAAAAEAWALARLAGATFEGFMTARSRMLLETPAYVPGEAVAHLTVQLTLVQMAALTASTTYESRDDALAALQRIAVAFAAAEEDVADEHDAMTYRALVNLRAAAVRDLAERSRLLPRVVPYRFATSMPGLWIANRIFADGGRAEQLLAENKWVHPAFAPPEGICLSR